MGVVTDPIQDVDEARQGLRAAQRALHNCLGDGAFRNWEGAADALEAVDRAIEFLSGYPTFEAKA